MKRLKDMESVISPAYFIFGFALLSVFSFTACSFVDNKEELKYRSAVIEEERRLFMEENRKLYTASRGEMSRTAGASQEGQTENQQTAAAPVQSDKTASAPAEPAAAKPVTKAEPKPVTVDAVKPSPLAQAAVSESKTETAKEESGCEQDLDLLARLITAEAQGEPYEAQVAVGAVVVNRVKSSSWPNTYKAVIYQNINGYYQFTPVVNGWIDKPAQPDCIKAAKAALNGADPTNGAQFYYDVTTTNPWMLSKTVSVRIGQMIFAF